MGKRAGFTLIELLVVIGIIVLLAGIVMPNFMKYIDKAKKVRARADIHSIENALAMYQTDWGIYPGQWSGAHSLHGAVDGSHVATLWIILKTTGTNGRGPYLSKEIPNDPYGEAYRYRAPVSGGSGYKNPLEESGYDLFSCGKDKTGDGTGEDDIACWDTGTD